MSDYLFEPESVLASVNPGAPTELVKAINETLLLKAAIGVPSDFERRFIHAVNASCTCGGKPAEDPRACPACMVWHRMKS
jgi:hypothetical protein